MNCRVNILFRVPLYQIYDVDPVLCEVLCNAFFARTKCWKREDSNEIPSQGYDVDLWPNCRYHLYAGALCMYASVVMERLFLGVHDEYMAKLYQENRSSFEQRTVCLLNDVFRENVSIALNVLEIDYERIFKMGEAKYFDGSRVLKRAYTRPRHAETCWGGCCRVRNPWSIRSEETSIELMAVAYRAKAMDFLAHNCCQSLIERRWHGRLRLSPTRTLISYLFPCFIYKEFALRKARGPEVIRATRIEESALSSHPTGKPNDEYKEKLLVRASKDPGFANTVDLDSPLIIAPDASTPTSVELKQLHNVVVSELPSAAANASKHVMKCAAPRFPVKEEDRSIVHHSTEPSPLVIERIAQSVVFPVREEQGRDESPIYDRFDDLPEYSGIIPLWLWSTLKFYGTTKAKFFYHVIFRILYVIVYAWVLVAKPRRRSTIPRISNYWPELFVALVQLSQLCDSMAAIRQRMPPATRIPGPWICNVLERYGRKLGRIRLVKFLLQSATEFTFTEMTAVNWFKE
ncbi:hypothetical protein Y032_0027g1510 [Ancylostoma ceylanicum]|uniref:Uncharacterized protein n=1 Tax=Ancylostoma ceylanicum TaxID=53326 RepID=A0A016UTA3_9BILA|nr:hypothetical protein Y032_0027g1510 [Ancylostoma ceylanicum]